MGLFQKIIRYLEHNMNAPDHPSSSSDCFKKCPKCGFVWPFRDDFLSDPDIVIIGYQADFKALSAGLFYFNHSCKGTMALHAGLFEDLHEGPIFEARATGSEACPEYCIHQDELRPCPLECECAYTRDIIQVVKKWRKRK
jgi:hypothetical protein